LFLPVRIRADVIEQLIVVVDGEPYTLTNLRSFAKNSVNEEFPTGSLQDINAADRDVLEQFVTDKLIEAEVREAGIRITDDDVDRYIEQVKKNNRLSDEDFKTALTRDGMTLAGYKISVTNRARKGRNSRPSSQTQSEHHR
jgi:parvulin-like peptidyl-prolyl isomerase